MAFIIKDELRSIIKENHIDKIVGFDDTIIEMGIAAAISEVRNTLTPGNKKGWRDGRPHYDVAAIFSATGDERNPLLLEITKVVAVWWIIGICNAGVIYEKIESRYDRATESLKDLASGESNDSTLPIINNGETEDESTKPFRSGSRPKFHHE